MNPFRSYALALITASVLLVSCGGSGTNSPTFTPSNFTATYINPNQQFFGAFNSMGQICGRKGNYADALFASSSTAFANLNGTVMTPPAGTDQLYPLYVNDSGEIFAQAQTSIGNGTKPVFYANATAAPVFLKMPVGVTDMYCAGLNNSRAMVAFTKVGDPRSCYYYASPTADPVLVDADVYGTFRPILSNSGAIYVVHPDGSSSIYSTPSSTPIPVLAADGGELKAFTKNNLLIGAVKRSINSGYQAAYFLPGSYNAPAFLSVPPGTMRSALLWVNSHGVGVGFYQDNGAAYHPCVWPTLSSQAVDFKPMGTGDDAMLAVFDDGSMVSGSISATEANVLTPKS